MAKEPETEPAVKLPPEKLIRPEGFSPCDWHDLSLEQRRATIKQMQAEGTYMPSAFLEGID